MGIVEEVRAFLAKLGSNIESSTAYDTAWVASLRAPQNDEGDPIPLFPQTLGWLIEHQHPDGSWGGPWPYYHDRLLSTLRAVLTLHSQGRRAEDRRRLERGISYIWRNAGNLRKDPWETIGFELIFPTLLAEAEQKGLVLPYAAFSDVQRMRQEKLARAPLRLMYDRRAPLPVNLEGLGPAFQPEYAGNAQEEDGAVGMSPSATAFLLQQCPDNDPARDYLAQTLSASIDGRGAPFYYPLETFERSWALYQLQHAVPELYQVCEAETGPILRFLDQVRSPLGWSSTYIAELKESDSTAVSFTVLSQAGYDLDPELLFQYEEADCFRTFLYERNASISANVHILGALRYCAPPTRASRVEKILGFLQRTRQPAGYWYDKWHVSPYYVTGRVILVAHDFAPDLLQPAVDWILYTQRSGGGWGYYGATLEETAYAILALLSWSGGGQPVPDRVLARGVDYLRRHFSPERVDYPPMWIGKSLYVPVQVAQAAVLAALWAYETQR